MNKSKEKNGVTRSEIARACGFKLQWVDQLIADGVISENMVIAKNGRTKYFDCLEAMGAIVQYYRDKANNPSKKAKEKKAPVELRKNEAEADWKRAKADMAELQLKELQGEMHRSEDVEAAFEDFGMTVRSTLLSYPGRLAVNCANAESAAEVSAIIKQTVNDTLNELKDYQYDPDFYAKRVREREGWIEDDAEGDKKAK